MNKALRFKGRFDVRIFDKHGKLKKVLTAHNGVVNVGKDKILGVMFNAVSQITAWFMGLINNSPQPTEAAADTMSDHGGWTEAHTQYDESPRPAWDEAAASGQQITSATETVFTMNATITIAGFFLVSDNTKGGAAGTLWCTALFDGGAQAVISGDKIKVTYTLST